MRGVSWTKEEIEEARGMVKSGLNYSDVGERFGKTANAVCHAARKYGFAIGASRSNDAPKERSAYKSTQTLCWTCAKSSGRNMCSWALAYVPVDGWNADLYFTDKKKTTYTVRECPQYEKEARA